MTVRAIAEVILNAAGHLQIKPKEPCPEDAFVYRVGAGVQWHPQALAFVAAEPQRWTPVELARHIRRVVRDEVGVDLRINATTTWTGIPEPLRSQLAKELGCEALKT